MFYVYGLYDKMNKGIIEFMIFKSELELKGVLDGMVNYTDSIVRRFPEDFEVRRLGYFVDTGDYNSFSEHSSINLDIFVRKEKKDGIQKEL